MFQEGDNTLCWHFSPEYIYELVPPDTGEIIRSSFGLDFTLVSGFGTLAILSYGSWAD